MELKQLKESINLIDNLYSNEEEIYFANKYIELKNNFMEYQQNSSINNIKHIIVNITQSDDKAIIYFDRKSIRIEKNVIQLIKVFVNDVIKNNKSQLLKKYDNISFDKENSNINLSFAHIEDIDDIIFYNFNIKTNTPKCLFGDMNDYLNSLITEPFISPEIKRKINKI